MVKRRRTKRDKVKEEILNYLVEADLEKVEIGKALKLEDSEFQVLLKEAMTDLAEQLKTKATETFFAEYFINSQEYISKLNKVMHEEQAAPRDRINAIKAQFEIQKDLLKTAQDLKIVSPNIQEVGVGGLSNDHLSELTPDQIREVLFDLSKEFIELRENFTENKNILDVPVPKLHFGKSTSELRMEEQLKAEANKDKEE